MRKILRGVPESEESTENTGLERCHINHPFPCVAFYELKHGEPMVVETLAALKSCLERQNLPPWSPADLAAVKSKFLNQAKRFEENLHRIQSCALQSKRRALEEQAEKILIKAAVIDLAIKIQKGNFLEDLSDNILEHAISNLKDYKFPFAPLLRIIHIKFRKKASDSEYFHKIKGENILSLQTRFYNIKLQAIDILNKLSRDNSSVIKESSLTFPGLLKLIVYRYSE